MFAQIFTRVKTCGDIYKSVNLWYNRNSTNEKYGGVNLKIVHRLPEVNCRDITSQPEYVSDWPKKMRKLSDEVLLRVRWLHMFRNVPVSEIKKEYKIPSTIIGLVFEYKAHAWVMPEYNSFKE